MKKNIIILTLALFFSSINLANALDFILGARTGYFISNPYINNIHDQNFDDIKKVYGQLYGPFIKLIFFSDLSIVLMGLTGNLSSHWHKDNGVVELEQGEKAMNSYIAYINVFRLDAESSIEYRLTNYFFVFAGYNYLFNRMEMRRSERISILDNNGIPVSDGDKYIESHLKIHQPIYGPGLGIIFLYNIYSSFFLRANLSGQYMQGKHDLKEIVSYEYNISDGTLFSPDLIKNESYKLNTKHWGLIFQPGLILNTGEYGPLFSIEFKYQYLKTRIDLLEQSDQSPKKWIDEYNYAVIIGIYFRI